MMLIECLAPVLLDSATDDATLVARLNSLARRERELRADFIVYLAEFDRRRLYAAAGFPSLFAWLTDHLHFAKASAFRRVTAARLHARMPAVAAYLRDGRLSLTKLCALKDVLEPDHCLALLEQAAALSEKEVEELAAVLDPRRLTLPPRDSIRPLAAAPPALAAQEELFASTPAPPPSPSASAPAAAAPPTAPLSEPGLGSAPEPRPPLRHVIKMTVGAELMDLLADVRRELSHAHPGASLEVLLAEAMKRALVAWRQRRRGATDRPRAPRSLVPSRTVPAHVRRAVWERDQGRCTFVAADGHRCTATHRLQLHHDQAFALGGPATVENIRLACSTHNDLWARADFGDALMNRFTHHPASLSV